MNKWIEDRIEGSGIEPSKRLRVGVALLLFALELPLAVGCDSNSTLNGAGSASGRSGKTFPDARTGAGAMNQDSQRPDQKPAAKSSTKPSTDSDAGATYRPPQVYFKAPKFSLTDQTGADFGTNELAGRVWIVNFMFTRCAATCPRQATRIVELQQHTRRWPDGDRLRYVSVTVDPEHDTAEKLRDYAALHHADPALWKFLTGDRATLHEISREGFKLPAAGADGDTAAPITHSSRFILVDRSLQVRGLYESLDDEDCRKLLVDLRAVLSELPTDSGEISVVGAPQEVFDPPWLDQRMQEQLATAGQIESFHDFTFTDNLEQSGIRFLNRVVADASREFKRNHYDHGTGIAVADVDGDGLLDLYFVNQVGGNELWRNMGQGRFEDITALAGVSLKGRVCVTASFADTDNDGDPDLYVTTTRHGNAFFVNDGHGRFQDMTEVSGLAHTGHSSGADFFDYDRDGRLDLFLTNVGSFTTDEIGYSSDAAQREYPYYVGQATAFGGHLFPKQSERSILYRNEGDNRFRDVSSETGLHHTSWSGDATPLDVNEDGWIDLYVVNMQGNDDYYENVGGKKFEHRSEAVFPKSPWGAMAVKSFDYNNDGRMDLYVTNMHADMWRHAASGPEEKAKALATRVPSERFLLSRSPGGNIYGNAFFENQGNGRFREVSDRVNAENYWPWGLSVGDLNADGFQDVFVTCSMNLIYRYQVNSLLLNDAGRRFHDAEFILGVEPRRDRKTATPWFEFNRRGHAENPLWNELSDRASVWAAVGSRSSAIVDLDGDGDLDIVTNDFNSAPMILISNLSQQNPDLHYLQIKLQGSKSNRDALGAKVRVTAADAEYTQVHDGQSGYLSQSAIPLYFGLGDAATVDKIAIQWPSGNRQVLEGPIEVNRQLVIEEIEATAAPE